MKETRLVILMGLPGSGKSYVAKHLTNRGFVVVSGEEVAREMFNAEQLQSDQYGQVYAQARERARQLLQQSKKVVLDGTNLKYEYRKQIYEECAGFSTKIIYLTVDKKTARKRIKKRVARGEGSDCDEEKFANFERQLELPRNSEQFVAVDSSDEKLLLEIDKLLK